MTPTPVPVAEQRIVYVSDDNSIFTINADGSSRRQIVGGASSGGGVFAGPLSQETVLYTWPTWSPAGDRLVVSRAPGPVGSSVAALALIEPLSSEETYIQISRRGPVDRVADGAFHYEMWSPDGERLALIAPNQASDSLELTEPALDGGEPEFIARDAPLYIQWSPDSKLLAVHDQQHLIIRDLDGDREDLHRASLSYRVPSFSADSASIALVADVEGEQHLISRKIDGGEETRLWRVSTGAVFAWSPTDPDIIAATVRSALLSFDYDGLAVFDVATGVRRVIYEGEVFAFWWSPDGSRIAVVTDGRDFFQWEVIEVESGDVMELAQFRPAPDFVTYLQFFDQFGPSHQVWSADSTSLVFAGGVAGEGRPRRRNQAWVIDVTGERDAAVLAEARQAYFVPTGPAG
jgi:TolB protein